MKKIAKIIRRILIILLAALMLFTLVTFVIHRVKTSKELELLKEKGYFNPISVGDYSLNVAIFGNEDGGHTIVSLAGLGMGDYSITEREMTSALENDNMVVFIDRAGYGLSDDTDNEMTIEYIVEDYRSALKNAGIDAPYILMPHSIGGAYANYWVSKYPNEIEAVVFLDGTQLSDAVFDENSLAFVGYKDKLISFLAKLGYGRYMLRDNYWLLPDNYSEEEQKLADALQLRTEHSIALASEGYLHDRNLQDAWSAIVTNDIPKLYICSSWGIQTKKDLTEYLEWFGRLKEKNHFEITSLTEISDEKFQEQIDEFEKFRQDIIYPYAEKMGNCKVVLLPGDHAIYEQKPEECGKIVKEFIDGLDR
ncbi:MAG: alpha/beta hydrolase [Acetatifactor sp.]